MRDGEFKRHRRFSYHLRRLAASVSMVQLAYIVHVKARPSALCFQLRILRRIHITPLRRKAKWEKSLTGWYEARMGCFSESQRAKALADCIGNPLRSTGMEEERRRIQRGS